MRERDSRTCLSDGAQFVTVLNLSRGPTLKRSTVSPYPSWAIAHRDRKFILGSHRSCTRKRRETSCETRRSTRNYPASDQIAGCDGKRLDGHCFYVEGGSCHRYTITFRNTAPWFPRRIISVLHRSHPLWFHSPLSFIESLFLF